MREEEGGGEEEEVVYGLPAVGEKRFALPNGSKIYKMFSFSQRILAFWGLAVLIFGTVLCSFK